MTDWTEVADVTTEYGSGDIDDAMLSEDGAYMLTEDGEYIVAEGPITDYTEVADSSERYIPEGVGLKVASEDFTWMLTEDKLVRLIHSKTDFTEVDDITTSWTEVGDA